jgi:hypothetical protein
MPVQDRPIQMFKCIQLTISNIGMQNNEGNNSDPIRKALCLNKQIKIELTEFVCCHTLKFLQTRCSSKIEPRSSTLMDGIQASASNLYDIPPGWSVGSLSAISILNSYKIINNLIKVKILFVYVWILYCFYVNAL